MKETMNPCVYELQHERLFEHHNVDFLLKGEQKIIKPWSQSQTHATSGKILEKPQFLLSIVACITLLTGEIPKTIFSKKDVDSFGLRKGQLLGCKKTLHGSLQKIFILRWIFSILPKIKKFTGVKISSNCLQINCGDLLENLEIQPHYLGFRNLKTFDQRFNISKKTSKTLSLTGTGLPLKNDSTTN